MLKSSFLKMSHPDINVNKSILEEFDELYLEHINNSKFNMLSRNVTVYCCLLCHVSEVV